MNIMSDTTKDMYNTPPIGGVAAQFRFSYYNMRISYS